MQKKIIRRIRMTDRDSWERHERVILEFIKDQKDFNKEQRDFNQYMQKTLNDLKIENAVEKTKLGFIIAGASMAISIITTFLVNVGKHYLGPG